MCLIKYYAVRVYDRWVCGSTQAYPWGWGQVGLKLVWLLWKRENSCFCQEWHASSLQYIPWPSVIIVASQLQKTTGIFQSFCSEVNEWCEMRSAFIASTF